jgi:hypothetical protein
MEARLFTKPGRIRFSGHFEVKREHWVSDTVLIF